MIDDRPDAFGAGASMSMTTGMGLRASSGMGEFVAGDRFSPRSAGQPAAGREHQVNQARKVGISRAAVFTQKIQIIRRVTSKGPPDRVGRRRSVSITGPGRRPLQFVGDTQSVTAASRAAQFRQAAHGRRWISTATWRGPFANLVVPPCPLHAHPTFTVQNMAPANPAFYGHV